MRPLSRRRPAALLAVCALVATVTACASTANAGSTPSPKSYDSVRGMLADADLVVRGTAGDATEETLVDKIPYTRTPVHISEAVLGDPESDNILVSQIGTQAQPPAAGLPDLVEPGRTYVLVLARTGDSTYDVVGPGVWWNPPGDRAELFVSSGTVDSRIPSDTTVQDLAATVREHGDALGSGE